MAVVSKNVASKVMLEVRDAVYKNVSRKVIDIVWDTVRLPVAVDTRKLLVYTETMCNESICLNTSPLNE